MKLTVTMFMTLDGVSQGPGGADEDRDGGFEYGGWFIPHADEDFGKAISARFADAEVFLLGRRTYEIFASHWPKVTDPDDPVASKLNSLPKYVPTTTLDKADWEGTTLLKDNVVAAIAELKGQAGGELQVHGSISLVQTLIREGLVDEYFIAIAPVVLGTGKRLFGEIVPTGLELTNSQATGSGLLLQTYQPTGAPALAEAPPPG